MTFWLTFSTRKKIQQGSHRQHNPYLLIFIIIQNVVETFNFNTDTLAEPYLDIIAKLELVH